MNPSRKQGYFRRVHTPVVTDVDSMTRSGAIFRSVPYAIERSTRAGKFWDVVIHYDCVEDIKSKDSLSLSWVPGADSILLRFLSKRGGSIVLS